MLVFTMNLGLVLLNTGKLEGASKLLKESLKVARSKLGERQSYTASIINMAKVSPVETMR